jgi:uncharacterized protein
VTRIIIAENHTVEIVISHKNGSICTHGNRLTYYSPDNRIYEYLLIVRTISYIPKQEIAMIERFFDINCMIGKWPYSKLHYNTACELSEVMGKTGICKSAAASIEAYRYDPCEENDVLYNSLKEYPEILPCFVLVPHITGEHGRICTDDVILELRQKKVSFVRLYPVTDGFSLNEWCCGDLLSSLEKNNITLLLHFRELLKENNINEIGDMLYDLCCRHPDLSVVILSFRHNNNRIIYRLMESCPNLYFEISFFGVFGQLEDIVRRYGSKRLIFGTNMPFWEPGRTMGLLNYSELGSGDGNAIAWGNAEELLLRGRSDDNR